MTVEDFSKYGKMVSSPKEEEKVKDRELVLWEKVQSQNKLPKQEAGHVEQLAKLEHQITQQQTMLQEVRSKLKRTNNSVAVQFRRPRWMRLHWDCS